jgi:hypothetical protein
MGSLKRRAPTPQKQRLAFNPSELDVIDRVYRAAWPQVLAHLPERDTDKNNERRLALSKRLFILAGGGPVEFDKLRDRVLATMPETLMSFPRRPVSK